MEKNVEIMGVTTYYAIDIGEKSYTVVENYDSNSGSYGFEVCRVDDDTDEITETEKQLVLSIVNEYKEKI